jgi:ABC-type xylose transport system substrate-binding protein
MEKGIRQVSQESGGVQMSELKDHRFCECDEIVREYRGQLSNEMRPYYLKSEADKVIAELEESHKKEVKELLILNREQSNAANRLRDSMEQVIRHQKFKRCLAMARRCHNESLWWYSKGYGFEKYDKFWEKWEKRWLELAEKFKEAK